MKTRSALLFAALTCLPIYTHEAADWPTLRGNVQRDGLADVSIKPPFRLAWAREIPDERIGTPVEPIVAGNKVFVATHAGSIYALDAGSGGALWRFEAGGPFLHSPAVADDAVVAGCADGRLYSLDIRDGSLIWDAPLGTGGVSASPTVAEDSIFMGTRKGDFVAFRVKTGQLAWRVPLGVPIRQTAAYADGRLFVTAEDLRVRCFGASDGKLLWISEQLEGQTARDYHPIVIKKNGRTFVIVRTNPVLNMGQRISRDRTMLCRSAGIDDSTWQPFERKLGPSLWGHDRKWMTPEKREESRQLCIESAKAGLRQPVQVIEGNFNQMQGVCPWLDSMRAQQKVS